MLDRAVLLIGETPETVNFADPAIPPGMTIEKVRAGLAAARKSLQDRGVRCDLCLVAPDDTAESTIEAALASATYDCVVIGAGVRTVPGRMLLFERVINLVHRAAPGATIAFNTRPDDSGEAALRWLPRD